MQEFDEWLNRLDELFGEAFAAIEATPDQQAYWETQPAHWKGGGDRAYIAEYDDLVRLNSELRELMRRRTLRLHSPDA